MAEKKQTEDIMKKLEEGIQNTFQDQNYLKYLRVMSQFHSYSINNCILIAMQFPMATQVAGFKTWNEKFNRHVKKGEKGIQIIMPVVHKKKVLCDVLDANGNVKLDSSGNPIKEEKEVQYKSFRPTTVFDVSQTEGEDLPTICSELKGTVDNYDKLLQAIVAISPVPVSFENITSGAKGYYSPDGNKIVVNENMSEQQNIKTLLHEITHAYLHGKDGIAKDVDKRSKEIQAESVAFVVSDYFGIDTSDYSFEYITSWSTGKETKELKDSLEIIKVQANLSINKIEEMFKEKVA